MESLPTVKPVLAPFRWLLVLAALLAFIAGVQLFILGQHTDRYFAWTIADPLMAAVLGAAYWGGGTLPALLSARERAWARVRVFATAATVFSAVMLAATLLHLDRFHLHGVGSARVAAWAWMTVYAAVPPLLLGLVALKMLAAGGDPPRRAPLSPLARRVLSVQVLALLGGGALCFISPGLVASLWPWKLTPLTGQVVGSGLLALGAGGLNALGEADWERLRIASIGYAALGILVSVAVARFPGSVDWHRWTAWAFLAFLAVVVGSGVRGAAGSRATRAS